MQDNRSHHMVSTTAAATATMPSNMTSLDMGACGANTRCSYNWPVLFLFLIVVAAIGGNILVCLAVRQERKLQNMFNFFLVSLALSDMMSATLVMPLSIVKALIGQYSVTITRLSLVSILLL